MRLALVGEQVPQQKSLVLHSQERKAVPGSSRPVRVVGGREMCQQQQQGPELELELQLGD